MRLLAIIFLLCCSTLLIAQTTTIHDVTFNEQLLTANFDTLTLLDVKNLDELTLSSFDEESTALNISQEFKNLKLIKQDGSWVLRPIGALAVATGTVIDIGTFFYWVVLGTRGRSNYPITTQEGWLIGTCFLVGTGIVVLGAFMVAKAGYRPQKASKSRNSSKQQQLDSIRRSEGY